MKNKEISKEYLNHLKEYFKSDYFINNILKDIIEKTFKIVDSSLYKYFSEEKIVFKSKERFYEYDEYDEYDEYYEYDDDELYPCFDYELDQFNAQAFCDEFDNYINNLVKYKQGVFDTIKKIIYSIPDLQNDLNHIKKWMHEQFIDCFINKNIDKIIKPIIEKYTILYVLTILNTENPNYCNQMDECIDYIKMKESIYHGMLKKIPSNYINLFPLAREMKRKFILHIGGTNSGKTYTAIQEMKKAKKGIYLGPLRLLAFEQYEKLNSEGCPCSLKTGEESKKVDGATHFASTIEMLNMKEEYDVAVIDEAQLISDSHRGGSWTNAILGILAKEIHVCAAPEAEEVLCKIITSCGDTYTTEYHKRNTPLIIEEEKFDFENGIKKGDALIVFSKKSVHSVAQDLKELNINSSIIYGSLPYDVRQNEAKKFINGTNDVVVSTDAIGLGMNLPIKRVIFLETTKYDGKEVRDLYPSEIKQIAGRAGRYGIFNEGYVNAYRDKNKISKGISYNEKSIKTVYLRFPEHLIYVDGQLSIILEQWDKMETNKGFLKADFSHEKKLCDIAESYTDDKKLIYDFITIPFDEDNYEQLDLWKTMLEAKINGKHLYLNNLSPLKNSNIDEMSMQQLEDAYKICDLIFYYNEKFENSLESENVMKEKEIISKTIIQKIENNKFQKRQCRICGKPLKWNFRYNICEECYYDSHYYY